MPEKIFPTDTLSKRERVERTLNLQPVDRVALHEQLSYNPAVIADITGKSVRGFDYTPDDIGCVIRQTVDSCFPVFAPLGTGRSLDDEGFTIQCDNWYSAIFDRPFHDTDGAADYLKWRMGQLRSAPFDSEAERKRYWRSMTEMQARVGETVIVDWSIEVGFCTCWSRVGLELFTFLAADQPELVSEYLEAALESNLRRLHAVADPHLSPVVLIAEDFATGGGPIFSPPFLRREFFPRVKRLTDAWHSHGLKVLFHSDGNWKRVIPDLAACGVDGFYCLEPVLGMDIVELKRAWPQYTWSGGVDGTGLMENGTPEEVRQAVHRQIIETDALRTGGLFIASSSEINPPVRPENFRAMISSTGELINPDFQPIKSRGT